MVENGNDTLRRDIRRNLNGIPILLTTTYTPCKQHLAYLGFDDIVMKSFNLGELKAKINRLQERLAPLQAETPQSDVGTRKAVMAEQMMSPSRVE